MNDKTYQRQSDGELSVTVLNAVSAYAWLEEDPDGFRLGFQFFEAAGRKMINGIQEIFNRVVADGLKAHRALQPVFENISGLSESQRKNAHDIYKALRCVNS